MISKSHIIGNLVLVSMYFRNNFGGLTWIYLMDVTKFSFGKRFHFCIHNRIGGFYVECFL